MLIDTWEIREATINDASFLLDAYYQIYGVKLDPNTFIDLLKKKIESNTSIICVAQNKIGNLIGTIVCELQDSLYMLKPTMQIKEFYISPKYRKLNLANDLFHHIEVAADMLGVFKIEVLCNLTATTTQNFYLRNKFKIDKKSYVKLI